LKGESSDFFILPAGFDASAPNSKITMEESNYLKGMIEADPGIFSNIDGWTSHSYPNPGFSGFENAMGKGTVRTYDWELGFLKTLGVTKTLPVFITETGWVHKLDVVGKVNTSIERIGDKLTFALTNVWNDKRIIAVTPFILSYNETPFDVFSWKDKEGKYYEFYNQIQSLKKVKGEPIQITKGQIEAAFVPPFVRKDKEFKGFILAKNIGESIWKTGMIIAKIYSGEGLTIENTQSNEIEPNQTGVLTFNVKNARPAGLNFFSIGLFFGNNFISNQIFLPQIILP
jgi:hypothetical protein